MKNLKLWSSVVAVGAVSVLTYSHLAPTEVANSQGYIMQGASQSTMTAQVEAAGGKITHAFNVIDAVSASLTPSQVAAVTAANPMLRMFVNADVNLDNIEAGWTAKKSLKFKLNKNTVKWKVKNNSETEYMIQKVDVSWPAGNGALQELKVAGKKIEPTSDGSFLNITLDEEDYIKVSKHKNLEINLKFDDITSVIDSDYEIALQMSDGSSVVMTPLGETKGRSPIRYKSAHDALEWRTLNTAEKELFVKAVIIDWPEVNGAVEQLKVNGKNLLDLAAVGGSATIELDDFLSIEEDADIKVKMEFKTLSSVVDDDYSVTLVYADGSNQSLTTTNSTPEQGADRDTFFPTIVRANEAHQQGFTGQGITVAVIDSGAENFINLKENTNGDKRLIHTYNVMDSEHFDEVDDDNGHGTHVASIIGNSAASFNTLGEQSGSYNGIAPDADLVVVKAFDEDGRASYAHILAAIEYVIENREALNIRVLNLSFSAIPSSNYWEDPINQAIMVAWEAGITVVAAAGNQGPDAMTIGVPGNTPYVITVGAVTDNYTPDNINDDYVTSFSSTGPTFEGFVKPELVAPGGHIQGLMKDKAQIAQQYEMYDDENGYFLLSGSSQSTAITSGIVALMLQKDPTLSPDDIKCRLTYTAKSAVNDEGQLAFSIFQQGAGLVDAMSALNSTASGCGNAGMDIATDIAGDDHYIGPARRYENDGDFYILDQEGLEWNGLYSDAHMWGNVRFISDAHMWGNVRFNSEAHMWGNVRFNSDAHMWGNVRFNNDAHMLGNVIFNSDAHMWGNVRFDSDSNLTSSSVQTDWVDQE